VRVCGSRTEALAAFNDLHGKVNLLGLVNEEVVGQEFLDGTQYFVNCLTWDGVHAVTDIWRHDRRRRAGGAFLFENMTLQPRDGDIESELAEYTMAALSALDYRFGAAHCEVMWTAGGPVLIEANARLMGASIDTSSFKAALGYTQAQLMAEMFLDPGMFPALAGNKYQIKRHLAEASFIFTKSGRLAEFSRQRDIEQLPSFHSFVGVPKVGEMVQQTVNTAGNPGFAYFLHEDRDVVTRDSQKVLSWQREDSCFRID
jgi:biotin carboxylase